MDLQHYYLVPSITEIFGFLLFILLIASMSTTQIRKQSKTLFSSSKLPPGPWKLPLVGNLHNLLMGGKQLPHHTITHLAKKYGLSLMHLQLGEVSTIVISSPKEAQKFLKTHDLIFSTRPQVDIAKIISYGFRDVIFSSYGNYWTQVRKIITAELLSTKRVQSFQYIREEEVSNLIRSILLTSRNGSAASIPINLSERITVLVNDILCRATLGKKCKDREELMACTRKLNISVGGLGDLFPSSMLLRVISNRKTRFELIHRKIDRILDDIINEHIENRPTSRTKIDMEDPLYHTLLQEDLVDVLLQFQETSSGPGELQITSNHIKAVILDIFAMGTEGSSTTLEWAMSELLKSPKIMKKAQAEVRNIFEGTRKIKETEIFKLKYLKLVIKETLRLHPPAPLFPRECREECEISGYQIPIKTTVIFNAWAIGRDKEYWGDNAETFDPERFDKCSTDYRGTNFEYIPFGAGRRMCPGISFGLANVELPLAQLLYHFDWNLPNGVEPENLDMLETAGVNVRRKNNLYLIPTPYKEGLDFTTITNKESASLELHHS